MLTKQEYGVARTAHESRPGYSAIAQKLVKVVHNELNLFGSLTIQFMMTCLDTKFFWEDQTICQKNMQLSHIIFDKRVFFWFEQNFGQQAKKIISLSIYKP